MPFEALARENKDLKEELEAMKIQINELLKSAKNKMKGID